MPCRLCHGMSYAETFMKACIVTLWPRGVRHHLATCYFLLLVYVHSWGHEIFWLVCQVLRTCVLEYVWRATLSVVIYHDSAMAPYFIIFLGRLCYNISTAKTVVCATKEARGINASSSTFIAEFIQEGAAGPWPQRAISWGPWQHSLWYPDVIGEVAKEEAPVLTVSQSRWVFMKKARLQHWLRFPNSAKSSHSQLSFPSRTLSEKHSHNVRNAFPYYISLLIHASLKNIKVPSESNSLTLTWSSTEVNRGFR